MDRCPLLLLERFFQRGNSVKQVSNKAVIRNLENGCFFVLIDGNDDFTVLHARQMLDGTGNANSDIKLRRNDFTRLTNLIIVWNLASINSSARCANSGAKLVSNCVDDREVFTRPHAATTRDDDFS